jgi:thioredoxin reductase (NADPH)
MGMDMKTDVAEAIHDRHVVDVAVVGAGPAGLFTVFQCGMLGLQCHVLDALPEIGGQCTALYPEKPIYDIPGFPKIAAGDLIMNLEAQAAPFKPVFHMGAPVTELKRDGARFKISNGAGVSIDAGAVIIAGGAGAFGPNKPPLPGIEGYEGKSVFYMVRRREDFAGKRIVIAGGGDSAVDWALSLSEIAQVSVIHRRDQFRAAPGNVEKLHALAKAGTIDLVIPYQLKALEGDGSMLRAVQVATLDGDVKTIAADALLAFFGLAAKLGAMTEWGMKISGHNIVTEPATGATGVDGLFAVGDIATYPNKLKLIMTGFAEAAGASYAAYKHLNPGKEIHMEYSTAKGVPGQAGSDIKTIAA